MKTERVQSISGRAGMVLTAVSLIGAMLAWGCGAGRSDVADTEGPSEVPRNVRVLSLGPYTLNEYLEVSGPVQSVEGADISTEEGGTIAAVPRDKGALVRKGDVLVLLDRRLIEAEMKSAEAALAYSEYNEEQTRKLYEAKQVSREEMLLAETKLDQAKAAADIARIRYERAAIKAPYDGVVADRYVEIGQLVSPGTRVARIVNPYTLKLAGAVSEREVRYVSESAPVRVALDGAEATLPGHVHWVGFEANPTTGKFPVEVYVENRKLNVRPGVVGRARVLKGVHADVVAIPRDAVVQGAEGPIVYVVRDGTAHAQPVELGVDQGLMVLATGGLSFGDRIVVRGQRELTDGAPVKIQEEATAADGSVGSDPSVIRQGYTVTGKWDSAGEVSAQ